MWRFCLLLALSAFAHTADADVIDTTVTDELISNEAKEEFEIESGIISLHSEDFAQALQAHPLLMVKFYAPWCEHSKAIKAEFEEAALTLRQEGSPIRLAEVDATEEKILAKREGAHSYPLLKWYKGGRPAGIYRQGREKLSLVDWLRSKTPAMAVEVNNDEEAAEFLQDNQVSVLGMFPITGSQGEKAFVEASYLFEAGVGFGVLRYLQSWAVKDTVWIRAKHIQGQEIFEGELAVRRLVDFVTLHSTPHVVEFKPDDWKTIFRDNRNKHFVFFSKKESSETDFEAVQNVAKDFKKEMMFVRVDAENVENEKLCQVFDIEATDVPTFRIATTTKKSIRKFRPEEENLTEENIRNFLARVKDGSLEPYAKKEEVKKSESREEDKKEEVKKNESGEEEEVKMSEESSEEEENVKKEEVKDEL